MFNFFKALIPTKEYYTAFFEEMGIKHLVRSYYYPDYYKKQYFKYIRSRAPFIDPSLLDDIFYGLHIYAHLDMAGFTNGTKLDQFLDLVLEALSSGRMISVRNGKFLLSNKVNPFPNSILAFDIDNKYFHVIDRNYYNSIYDEFGNQLVTVPNLLIYNPQNIHNSKRVAEIAPDDILIHDLSKKKVIVYKGDISELKNIL